MKYIKPFLLCFVFSGLWAQGETDVYLIDLTTDHPTPLNISRNPGYDNQPSFWDNDYLLYTRTRAGQTDIVRYHLNSKRQNGYATPKSEYSPYESQKAMPFLPFVSIPLGYNVCTAMTARA